MNSFIFPLSLLLMPTASIADDLLHTRKAVVACSSPRATRVINNAEDPRQTDPGWVSFVEKDGHCFQVTPDQLWEQISVADGLVLLRRSPPVAGEPPLFFRLVDVTLSSPPSPSPLLAPIKSVPSPVVLPTMIAPARSRTHREKLHHTAADPAKPVALPRTSSVTLPAALSAPLPAVKQTTADPRLPSAQAEQHPVPTSSDSGGSGGLGAALISSVGIVIGVKAVYPRMRRKRALRIALSEIDDQEQRLHVRKIQLTTKDFYGTIEMGKWYKEKEVFCRTRILPLLAANGLSDQWPLIAREVDIRIELSASKPFDAGVIPERPFSDPQVFHPNMDPIHYERHCAMLLRRAGWDAQVTVASGDQGTDVLARKHGKVLVLQCKLYKNSVGNGAVQEVSAARLHQRADFAAVVSNASFTASARQLAGTNSVYLLHHEQLLTFNPL